MVLNIAEKALEKGTAAFYKSGNVLAVKYRAIKDNSKSKPKTVCLLSTAHPAQMEGP